MTAEKSMFAVGQRVRLIGYHPWEGSSGVIADRWRGAENLGLDWEVLLDAGDYPGHQVAAGEHEMQPERRSQRA